MVRLAKRLRDFSRWLVAATLALPALACYRGDQIPVRHQRALFVSETRLLLFDGIRPGGKDRVDWLPSGSVITAYDIEAKRAVWTKLLPFSSVVVSANGRHAATFGLVDTGAVPIGLLNLDDGSQKSLGIRAQGETANLDHPERRTRISDDGAIVASVLDRTLRVWDVRRADPVLTHSFPDRVADSVEFIPGTHDVCVGLLTPLVGGEWPLSAVAVFAQRGERWELEFQTDAKVFAWTARGLIFVNQAGVSVYDRRQPALLVRDLTPSNAQFSADGRYMAYLVGADDLKVYDFDQRRVVRADAWHPGLRFNRHVITAMYGGQLWRFDLAAGNSKLLRDFGDPAKTVKIPFVGGTTTSTKYNYQLSPSGTILYYEEPGEPARVYQLDKL